MFSFLGRVLKINTNNLKIIVFLFIYLHYKLILTIMNTTNFSSAKKEHWRDDKLHGSRTACNRKTSGIGANESDSFLWWVENHSEACCSKCLIRFNEYKSRKK